MYQTLRPRRSWRPPGSRRASGRWAPTPAKCAFVGAWILTHRSEDSLYIHLHDDQDRILRLAQGSVEVLQNGDNPERVLLSRADKMIPIEYEEGTEPRQSPLLFKNLVLDALACPPVDRWVAVWRLCPGFLEEDHCERGVAGPLPLSLEVAHQRIFHLDGHDLGGAAWRTPPRSGRGGGCCRDSSS